jgi:hypothetical protein
LPRAGVTTSLLLSITVVGKATPPPAGMAPSVPHCPMTRLPDKYGHKAVLEEVGALRDAGVRIRGFK